MWRALREPRRSLSLKIKSQYACNVRGTPPIASRLASSSPGTWCRSWLTFMRNNEAFEGSRASGPPTHTKNIKKRNCENCFYQFANGTQVGGGGVGGGGCQSADDGDGRRKLNKKSSRLDNLLDSTRQKRARRNDVPHVLWLWKFAMKIPLEKY